jgi:hypothetical protein
MSCSSLEFLQACKTLICEALEETMKVILGGANLYFHTYMVDINFIENAGSSGYCSII